VLSRAREAIGESWRQTCALNKNHPQAMELFDPDKMPGLHDPFAGGATIPLEAQRLGLKAYASDLNPVAVLINKAMIELAPKFSGRAAVHPDAREKKTLLAQDWRGAAGLAEDVRRYGKWLRDEAEKRIGHLYSQFDVTKTVAADRPDLKPLVGQTLTPIAWLWARTVKSPSPAFRHIDVPLASTFILSSKPNKEVYVSPITIGEGYQFAVYAGPPPAEARNGTSFGKQKGFRCLLSQAPISYEYVREEALADRMGQKLMAVVAEGVRGRVYFSPSIAQEQMANLAEPAWSPDLKIPEHALGFRVQLYGMRTFGDLFTRRQLTALTTFTDLMSDVRDRIRADATAAGISDDGEPLHKGGDGATAYAEAVSVYLAFAVDKTAEYGCTIVPWYAKEDRPKGLFARQAIPMVWDFAEVNPFCDIGGSLEASLKIISQALVGCDGQVNVGSAIQREAQVSGWPACKTFISTDPPYYDNIGYADLSDFFYVWLRKSLRPVFPDLLSTIAVPKSPELIAAPFRHGSETAAENFFLHGMTDVMSRLAEAAHPGSPLTIYYAFKQSETKANETASAGWETFLGAVLTAGLSIGGTWPMRTERAERSVGLGTNSLASSIILVCRRRAKGAGTISRRQFVRRLNEALPAALARMTGANEGEHSPVAPVDLSQAIIGPGMAIFSRYDAVLEADGTAMTVKTALQLINRFLAEDDFDGDTQFCLHWFEQHGWENAKFGEADTLARAKGTSVDGVKAAGVIEAGSGNVRLLKWKEYPANWNPSLDTRLPVWEALHQLIQAYSSKGDAGAGKVLKACAGKAEAARQLAYRLYTLCERKGWAEDARAYNEVVTGWSGIERAAGAGGEEQRELFDG
jgi:putative DNA methylase